MKSQTLDPDPRASCIPVTHGITIIYEDRATGLHAKRFSDMLSASLGDRPPRQPACWRLELIDFPGLAEEIFQDTVASEFVILSMRGDTSLSSTTKQWLELWLERVPLEATCLIALFDPIRSVVPHAEGARCYLRHVAAKAGVAFFAHCAVTPSNLLKNPNLPSLKMVRHQTRGLFGAMKV